MQITPCAAALLRKFIFRTGGSVGCPSQCEDALKGVDWEDRISASAGAYLEANKKCGFSGKIDLSFHTFEYRRGNMPFKKDESSDLYYAFHDFTATTLEASCSVNCGQMTTGCCCSCTGKCGAVLKVTDDYDFCSSFKPGGHTSVGNKLARCGCIIDDYRRKHGVKDGGAFKVNCNVGLKSGLELNSSICNPPRPKDHPTVPRPY